MKATFAAGCFWHVEHTFARTPGVGSTKVGYTGGNVPDPTYAMVCGHNTGHAEAVQVEFDPQDVSYEKLLEIFWKNHDPTTFNRQGPDVGPQYRSAIFCHDEAQLRMARQSRDKMADKYDKPIVTEIRMMEPFYDAEEYHQKFMEKHSF